MFKIAIRLRRANLLTATHVWFAREVRPADAVKLVAYRHCRSTEAVNGFTRESQFTKLIRIDRPDDEILKDFTKTSQYEVRRASKESLSFGLVQEAETFRTFFNEFAVSKNLPPLAPQLLAAYWPQLVITEVSAAGEPLVMHAYLLDKGVSRAALWKSASHFRSLEGAEGQQQRNLIGRANRLLHFSDMKYLRDEGFETYDLGGYAPHTDDPALKRINDFKDSLGGQLVEESNYLSAGTRVAMRLSETIPFLRKG